MASSRSQLCNNTHLHNDNAFGVAMATEMLSTIKPNLVKVLKHSFFDTVKATAAKMGQLNIRQQAKQTWTLIKQLMAYSGKTKWNSDKTLPRMLTENP